MIIITASGTISTGTTLEVDFPMLQGGYDLIYLELSVENTTTIRVEGIDNIYFMSKDESSDELRDGFELGGDFVLDVSKIRQVFPNATIPKILGIIQFTFDQSTGSDVDYSILMILEERR